MAPELFHFTYACPDNPWCGGGGAQRDFEILHHLEKDWKGLMSAFGQVAAEFPSLELAAAFQRLLTEPELRTRLGTNGREWARRFDWPSTARMQGEFYQQVLDCLHGAPLPPPGIVNTMESFLPT